MTEHPEMMDFQAKVTEAVDNPDAVYAGHGGELIAIKAIEQGKYVATIYKETPDDGFIITAFLTRRIRSLERREKIWPR